MFHLIRKYPNRKLYDTHLKKFVTQADLFRYVLNEDEIRIEDSDTYIDITHLEVSKALTRALKSGRKLPAFIKKWIVKKGKNELEVSDFLDENSEEEEVHPHYIPAEIRLFHKSLEYIDGALGILSDEMPFDKELHTDFYKVLVEFQKKLLKIKDKHGLD